ncbi:MAG: DUF3795 domain-containing protein [candidate division WOR-3 bacterium]
MNNLIGFCGLKCNECPAFIATKNDDDKERARIAREWAEEYKHEFKTEDINCDGCTSIAGRHVGYCSVCELRACAIKKRVKNCAYCKDYECKKLSDFFNIASQARKNLEKIRNFL